MEILLEETTNVKAFKNLPGMRGMTYLLEEIFETTDDHYSCEVQFGKWSADLSTPFNFATVEINRERLFDWARLEYANRDIEDRGTIVYRSVNIDKAEAWMEDNLESLIPDFLKCNDGWGGEGMIHRGEIVQKRIIQSGISVTIVADKIHRSRRTMYNLFDQHNISLDLIIEIGKAIHHDFSQDFKELAHGLHTHRQP